MPEGSVTITASGTDIGYQWFAKDLVGSIAKLSQWGTVDPLDSSISTTYSVNASKTKMQLMNFLEDGSNVIAFVPNAYASIGSDYSKRSPMVKGDTLGILLASGTGNLNQPVQEKYDVLVFTWVDLIKTTVSSGYTMIFSKNDTIASVVTSGTGAYTGSLFTFAYNKRDDLLSNKTFAGLDPSLVGYWDMETTTMSGSQVLLKDLSGYGNNGVCYNNTSSGACGLVWPKIVNGNGKSGKAMSFDGVDDYITMNDNINGSLDIGYINFTINILVYAQATYGSIINKGLASNWNSVWYEISWFEQKLSSTWALLAYDNQGCYKIDGNKGIWDAVSRANISRATWMNFNIPCINLEGWYLLTVVYDRLNGLKFYNNGTFIYNNTYFSDPLFQSTNIDNTLPLYIWSRNGSLRFSWLIDEVRIYNRALSDSEISILYSATK
jgi:Concanavalin A-like lectin/glucanases superfamily